MPAAKRKRTHGGAREGAGRPAPDGAATSITVRLAPPHRAMLARLRLLWAVDSDTEAMRRALEMASDMFRE